MIGTGLGYTDEEIVEGLKQKNIGELDELIPQLDPLYEDEDDKEWAEMLEEEYRNGKLKLIRVF